MPASSNSTRREPCTNGRRTPSVPISARDAPGGLVLGMRPESLELASDGVAAVVEVVEELGADAYLFCVADLDGRQSAKLVARVDGRHVPRRGDRVTLRPRPGEIHVFDAESGERLDTG